MEVEKLLEGLNQEDWVHLLKGLQEKLKMTQLQLIEKLDLKITQPKFSLYLNKGNVSEKNKYKILNFLKKNKVDIKKLILLGKGEKVGNNIIYLEDCITCKDIKQPLLVKRQNKVFINTAMLFPFERNKRKIYFFVKNDKFIVFYPEKASSRPYPLILPKLLEITLEFLIGLGIYLSDGSRNRNPKITNSDALVIKQSVIFYQLLGIPKEKLIGWVQLHERTNKNLKEVKKFWLSKTDLKANQITEIRIKKSSGNASIEQFGTLHLEAPSILLRLFISELLKLTPKIIKNIPKEQYKYLLQGLFAGDGSIELTKKKTIREINFTNTSKEMRNIVSDLLKKLNINHKIDEKKNQVRIYGYENFKKLYELDLFKYHSKRNEKFMLGMFHINQNRR